MLRVAAFDLGQGKDKYCTVYGSVPNWLLVISMSTRFHDKTVEAADNLVYNVLCFFLLLFFIFILFFFFYLFFFVNVFCVFSSE